MSITAYPLIGEGKQFLGAQMIFWEDDFCREIARRGFRVIRFDNRDVGLSTRPDTAWLSTALEAAQATDQPINRCGEFRSSLA